MFINESYKNDYYENYILNTDEHEYYIRFATHIKEDLERGWSSWNFGGGGFDGSFDELVDYITNPDSNSFEISYFEFWKDEDFKIKINDGYEIVFSTTTIRELYPDYWCVVDNVNGRGLAGHYIDVKKYNLKTLGDIVNMMESRKYKTEFSGSGSGNFFETDSAKLLYSQYDENTNGYHIIEI